MLIPVSYSTIKLTQSAEEVKVRLSKEEEGEK